MENKSVIGIAWFDENDWDEWHGPEAFPTQKCSLACL